MSTSDYTGHVEPHGDPATRELADITITKMSVGPMDNNTYLLVCRRTGDATLIDAARESDRTGRAQPVVIGPKRVSPAVRAAHQRPPSG